MRRLLFAALVLGVASVSAAGEPHFKLSLSAGGQRAASPTQEAQAALWSDPMVRLMLAMDSEVGHVLIGQPGGRTPPLIRAGLRSGVSPRILSAAIDHSLSGSAEPPTAVAWPWSKNNEPAAPPMEEQLAQLLARRLERQVLSGSTEGP